MIPKVSGHVLFRDNVHGDAVPPAQSVYVFVGLYVQTGHVEITRSEEEVQEIVSTAIESSAEFA